MIKSKIIKVKEKLFRKLFDFNSVEGLKFFYYNLSCLSDFLGLFNNNFFENNKIFFENYIPLNSEGKVYLDFFKYFNVKYVTKVLKKYIENDSYLFSEAINYLEEIHPQNFKEYFNFELGKNEIKEIGIQEILISFNLILNN